MFGILIGIFMIVATVIANIWGASTEVVQTMAVLAFASAVIGGLLTE